jgi:hypothetical protein
VYISAADEDNLELKINIWGCAMLCDDMKRRYRLSVLRLCTIVLERAILESGIVQAFTYDIRLLQRIVLHWKVIELLVLYMPWWANQSISKYAYGSSYIRFKPALWT